MVEAATQYKHPLNVGGGVLFSKHSPDGGLTSNSKSTSTAASSTSAVNLQLMHKSENDRRRKVEVKCMELEEMLESRG